MAARHLQDEVSSLLYLQQSRRPGCSGADARKFSKVNDGAHHHDCSPHMLSATVGFAACLAAPVIRRAAAKSGQNLRIGYVLPLQSQLGAGATAFADEITKRTTGRITVQQFPKLVGWIGSAFPSYSTRHKRILA